MFYRIAHRAATVPHRHAHNDGDLLASIAAGTHTADAFVPERMDVTELTVDTTDGFRPGLDAIAKFVAQPGRGAD